MQRMGFFQDAAELGNRTIGQVLDIDGFGARCLVDLLTSMEAFLTTVKKPESPDGNGSSSWPTVMNERNIPEEKPISPWLLLPSFLTLRLPRISNDASLRDILLDRTTYKCLERNGFGEGFEQLEDYTVGELLALPGMGRRGLVNLLRALEVYRSEGRPLASLASGHPSGPQLTKNRSKFLEDELRSLVASATAPSKTFPTERNVTIVLWHTGLDGDGGGTFQEVGEFYGLTRERVRQICDRTYRALTRSDFPTPLLDRALKFVADLIPAAAEAMETGLQELALTSGKFRLEGLVRAAQLLRRTVDFHIETIAGERMAIR
jgi:hypothetical protein